MLSIYKTVLYPGNKRALSRLLWNFQIKKLVAARMYSDATIKIPQDKPLRIERELPDPRANRVKLMAGFFLFSGIMVASLAVIFNYEKTENPIISTTLYQLRRSQRTKELLGENIEFSGLVPWVYGKLNNVAGKVKIRFYIKGDKGPIGEVRLIADRANKNSEFLIHEWSLTVDKEQVDLLAENSLFLSE